MNRHFVSNRRVPRRIGIMLHALRSHRPEYFIEATLLELFMISACVFTILLEYPALPIVAALPDSFVCRMIALRWGSQPWRSFFRRRPPPASRSWRTHCASGSICWNASARASKNANSLVSKFPLNLRDDFRRPVPLRLRWRRATPARCLRGGVASRHNRPSRAGGSVPGQSRALRR